MAYFEKFSRSLSSSGNVSTYSEYLTRDTAHYRHFIFEKIDRGSSQMRNRFDLRRGIVNRGKEVIIFMLSYDMICSNKIKFYLGFKKCAE